MYKKLLSTYVLHITYKLTQYLFLSEQNMLLCTNVMVCWHISTFPYETPCTSFKSFGSVVEMFFKKGMYITEVFFFTLRAAVTDSPSNFALGNALRNALGNALEHIKHIPLKMTGQYLSFKTTWAFLGILELKLQNYEKQFKYSSKIHP